MQIETTAQTHDILRLQSSKKLVKRLISLGINILEKYFGTKLLLEIPRHLQEINPEIFPPIDIAHKLKSLGIINELRKIPKFTDEPFLFRYATWPFKNLGSGADLTSEKSAIWKALGESVERYLWRTSDAFYRDRLIKKSYSELKDSALDIFNLAGFSKAQREELDILQFDEKTKFSWLRARSLISGKKVLCPAQLVSARYFQENVRTPENRKQKEPLLRWIITTGLATGRSLEEATTKGILEVIERDAFMISYLNKISPPLVDLENLADQDEDLLKIIKNFKRYCLEVYLLQLPTDFPVHVYSAVTVDRSGLGPALSVGASADFDLKTCLIDALSESLSVRMSLKAKIKGDQESLKKMTRRGRLVFWSQKENLPKTEFLLKGKKIVIDLERERSVYSTQSDEATRKQYYGKKLLKLKNALKKKSYAACYAELTTPDIEKLGFHCAKVVIPELQPLHLDESIPYFGGKRLCEVPQKLGYKPADELNKCPHPFP